MGMYIQMGPSHANVNQHRIHVNHGKYLSLAFTFTEKAEIVYRDICFGFSLSLRNSNNVVEDQIKKVHK